MLVSDNDRERISMLQDVDVPHSKSSDIIKWADNHGLEYLWLCPVNKGSGSMFSVSGGEEWVMNIGLYGVAEGLPRSNLDLQRLVAACNGKTALYAHIYASYDEFWSWYGTDSKYRSLRARYQAEIFLDLWEKVGGIASSIT